MLGVRKDRNEEETIDAWKKQLVGLRRPCSAALDAFMFANHDVRVLKGRDRLSSEDGESTSAGRVDWGKCESRHLFARSSEALGDKRPLTGWSDASNTTMPDWSWNDWVNSQVCGSNLAAEHIFRCTGSTI